MRVALTFDTEFPGRPAASGTEERILAVLAEADVRATFFLQGRWVRANPEIARRIAEAGHLVGNHSNYHAPMDGLTDELLRRDVQKAENTIHELTGIDPRPWFRCPFGAGGEDARVLEVLEELGYRHVGWDVDPQDWEQERTVQELLELVRADIRGRDTDSIVLLHSWPASTAHALPHLLESLAADDVELLRVDALSEAD